MTAKLIRTVQACRRQVPGLNEDEVWRLFLAVTVGKNSLRAMTGRELGRVIDALHAKGAPRLAGKKAGQPLKDDRAQARMARGLWIELHREGHVNDPSEAALDRFAERITRKAHLRWCGPADLNKVVEALKAWRDRTAGEAA